MEQRLPALYTERMKKLLGAEYESYLACFAENNISGLRVNTLKLSGERFEKMSPFPIERVPWIRNGYYYEEGERPARHPYYYAGLYYLQEPSAMTPASLLPVVPGDRVLDLCAAPGGKSTELGARLGGRGVLVANDISNSRAKALLKNIELFGIKNAAVISESPAKLAGSFAEYFDKILVDAPCSGEGMFRKSPAICKNWEQYGVDYYHKLQLEILPHAAAMLKEGGYLLYSTCTFSPEEDEQTVAWLLDHYPELEVVPLPGGALLADPALSYEGFDTGRPEWADHRPETAGALRLWPHKIRGEGHFMALFHKRGGGMPGDPVRNGENRTQGETSFRTGDQTDRTRLIPEAQEFLGHLGFLAEGGRMEVRDGKIYLVPEELPPLNGLRVLRSGLYLGEMKKNRFEPGQALACALKKEEYDHTLDLSVSDERVLRYLKCESIEAPECPDGWCLVCTDGFPLGWGKAKNGVLKNKYLPGWRYL